MSMYFIGIDISKYKHDCCIISAADQKVVSKVTIKNNKAGFDELLTIINSLSNPEDIRIGFESTAHYALNLELFLESSLLTFMEVNPVLISEYKKSKTLRRTKTDSVDCESMKKAVIETKDKTITYEPSEPEIKKENIIKQIAGFFILFCIIFLLFNNLFFLIKRQFYKKNKDSPNL